MMPTVILIPGLMNDGWVWTRQLPTLSRLCPVFVACNEGMDDLQDMAGRIEAATAGPLLVVGHSMGGRVALEILARAPDRVAGLALLSTGVHGVREGEIGGRQRLVALAEAEGMDAVAEEWLTGMMAEDASAQARNDVRAMLVRSTPAAFAAQQRALLSRTDRTALLSIIDCPTLVATGEQDGWASPAQHVRIAASVHTASLAVIPHSGHMLPVEAPDRLTELLVELIERTTGR